MCLRYKMTVLVRDRCKQEKKNWESVWPWEISKGWNMLLAWLSARLSGCLAQWEEKKREGTQMKGKLKKKKSLKCLQIKTGNR